MSTRLPRLDAIVPYVLMTLMATVIGQEWHDTKRASNDAANAYAAAAHAQHRAFVAEQHVLALESARRAQAVCYEKRRDLFFAGFRLWHDGFTRWHDGLARAEHASLAETNQAWHLDRASVYDFTQPSFDQASVIFTRWINTPCPGDMHLSSKEQHHESRRSPRAR